MNSPGCNSTLMKPSTFVWRPSKCRTWSCERVPSAPPARRVDIAFEVGYASQSHMTGAFAGQLGATPKVVRSLGAGPAPGSPGIKSPHVKARQALDQRPQ
jgi:hypothetical protein